MSWQPPEEPIDDVREPWEPPRAAVEIDPDGSVPVKSKRSRGVIVPVLLGVIAFVALVATVVTLFAVPGILLSKAQTPALQQAGFSHVNIDVYSSRADVVVGTCAITLRRVGDEWHYYPSAYTRDVSVVVTTAEALLTNEKASLAGCR